MNGGMIVPDGEVGNPDGLVLPLERLTKLVVED